MEGTVLVIGFVLGGKVGIGTVISVCCLGSCLQMYYKVFKVDPKKLKQQNLLDVYNNFKNKKLKYANAHLIL